MAQKVTPQSIIASNWPPHLKSLIELARSLCHSGATCFLHVTVNIKHGLLTYTIMNKHYIQNMFITVCSIRITDLLLSKSWIYDKDDSIDSKWRFCNICRDDHLTANSTVRPLWRCRFEDSLLQIWWQCGVQRNTLHLANFWSKVVHFPLYSLASFINFLHIKHCICNRQSHADPMRNQLFFYMWQQRLCTQWTQQ